MLTQNRLLLVLLVAIIAFLMVGLGSAGKKKEAKPTKLEAISSQQEKDQPASADQVTGETAPVAEPIQIQPETVLEEPVTGQVRIGEYIEKQVISSGGTDGSTAMYSLQGTVSQTATGYGSSTGHQVSHGYYQQTGGSCCAVAGDANHDGAVNVADAVHLINYIFKGGPAPECMAEGDPNNDGSVNVADAVSLINYIFKGGPPPICGSAE